MSQFSNILLIDTSQPTVWVALVIEGKVMAEKEWEGDKTLGVKLLEVIEEIFPTPSHSPSGRGRNVDRIAVHGGPGHFMATRTGVVTAQLLAQTWGVELVSVDGLGREEMIGQALEAEPVGVVQIAYT